MAGPVIGKQMIATPLFKFSFYTHLQSEVLLRNADEIFVELDAAFINSFEIDCTGFNNIWGRIWLWVLGSYEIVRTMDQYDCCFSERVRPAVKEMKFLLAGLRIPMAKQERRGRKQGRVHEPSVSSINGATKDFGFNIDGQEIYFRDLVQQFQSLIRKVTIEDVLSSLDDVKEAAGR